MNVMNNTPSIRNFYKSKMIQCTGLQLCVCALYACIYTYVNVCLCACVCVHMCVCVCVWGGGVKIHPFIKGMYCAYNAVLIL